MCAAQLHSGKNNSNSKLKMSPSPPAGYLITPLTEVPDNKEEENKYKIIGELPLHENVGGGKSANTSVSVVQGVVRIERDNDAKRHYRIVVAFHLQVKIHGFEMGYFKTVDRLFDFVSLRYLHNKDEVHEVLPDGNPLITGIEVTEESTKTKSAGLGVSGTVPIPTVTPSLSIQVGREEKLTVKRNVDSWTTGLSNERWYQKRPSHFEHGGEYHGEETTQRLSRHHHVFQVQSQHAKDCDCECPFSPEFCPFRESDLYYSRCVHWFWQVQAQPRLWVPEIYESVTFLITVTRIVDPDKIDLENVATQNVQRYLHFDFVVKTRLRELGWTLRDRFSPWRPRKPAEVRAKTDFGYPLGVEKVKFCIRACPEGISWPETPTGNLQQEAVDATFDAVVRRHAVPHNLGSARERKKKAEQDRERQYRDAERATLETNKLRQEMENRLREMESRHTAESMRRDIDVLKDTLASRSYAPCRCTSSSRSSSTDSYYEGQSPSPHHHHNHHHHHHNHHHHHHHLHESYERRSHEYGECGGGTASHHEEYPSDWEVDSTHYELPRGRATRRSHPAPEMPIVSDPHQSQYGSEEDDLRVHRSVYVSRRRRRSFSSTGLERVHLGRHRSRASSAGPEVMRCRRHMHLDGMDARIAERIDEFERRLRAEEEKAAEERQRLREEAEKDMKARREEQERRESKPPSKRLFKPGLGVKKQEPEDRPIELVDHPDPCELDQNYEWVRKKERQHHHHRRKSPTLLVYLAGGRLT
ncbi:hypothetical protein QBC47DRAFT_150752 [Echria macrotheca]|uniref:Uncharacterized protein n=1 Tax=Echria macrotheca TaxID=438768 RepID=A0AAJ0B537_9PEZI|nr:hypothetical protein QBC47DRAFT_150752 [Echria macrotheca]